MLKKVGEEDEDVDPFQWFGHSIQVYFRMIEKLIYLFLFMTILFIPVFYFYSQGGAYNDYDWTMINLSMGNLGHAEPVCISIYPSLEKQAHLTCKLGKISKLHAMGMVPSLTNTELVNFYYCSKFETSLKVKK